MADKQLALALNFKDAPAALKKLAEKYQQAWLRYEKAKAQMNKWNDEFLNAEKSMESTRREWNNGLAEWDPAKTKDPVLEDVTEIPAPVEPVKTKAKA